MRFAQLAALTSTVLSLSLGCTSPDPEDSPGADDEALPHPCTSAEAQTEAICRGPSQLEPGSLGTGPALRHMGGLSQEIRRGFVDVENNRLVVAVEITGNGGSILLGVDLATGNRAVLSGDYDDPASGKVTVGSGPPLGDAFDPVRVKEVFDVQPGPDGMWYVASTFGVIRVDPATGDRRLVLDALGAGQPAPQGCAFPGHTELHHVMYARSLTVGDDGTIYVPMSVSTWEAAPLEDESWFGGGVLAYKDGACRVVTRAGAQPGSPDDVGKGPAVSVLDLNTLRLHEGAIWTNDTLTESLFRIDLATGDRGRVSSATNGHTVGTGDAQVGDEYLEHVGDGWLTVGDEGTTVVDPATGARTALTTTTGPGYSPGPMWAYPGKPWVIVGSDNAFVLVHRTNGDSQVYSY